MLFDKQKALEDANDAKLQGNDLFRSGQYDDALLKYDLALQLVADVPSSDELRSACYLNRATCFLKMVCPGIEFLLNIPHAFQSLIVFNGVYLRTKYFLATTASIIMTLPCKLLCCSAFISRVIIWLFIF